MTPEEEEELKKKEEEKKKRDKEMWRKHDEEMERWYEQERKEKNAEINQNIKKGFFFQYIFYGCNTARDLHQWHWYKLDFCCK